MSAFRQGCADKVDLLLANGARPLSLVSTHLKDIMALFWNVPSSMTPSDWSKSEHLSKKVYRYFKKRLERDGERLTEDPEWFAEMRRICEPGLDNK
jgi:hypothetical protein